MKRKTKYLLCIAVVVFVIAGVSFLIYKKQKRIEAAYYRAINEFTDNQDRYVAMGFDDFRDSDFTMVLPLLNEYGATATFNRISWDTTLDEEAKKRIETVLKNGNELGNHTWMHCNFIYNDPLFNGQDPAAPEGNQEPFPTNEQLRSDYGEGKNAFGFSLDDNVKENLVAWYDYGSEWSAFDSTWGELTDEECQIIRDTFSIMKDGTGTIGVLDVLSNTYLGTTGSSRGSWDEEKQCYTGGIFTGCRTSANHEIWERILEVTKLFYEDQLDDFTSFQTWSWPGPSPTPFVFEKEGKYYYDEEHTKLYNYLARMESSLYENEDGSAKYRSFDEVLREAGYTMTHDNFYPSREDGTDAVMMSKQLILNASLSRKDAVVYSTNRTVDYSEIVECYPEEFFDTTSSKNVYAQMYDAGGAFYDFIEATRQDTANGMVHGEVIDSVDSYSEQMFLRGVLEYCEKEGIQVVSKAEAYDVCFDEIREEGNLIYNSKLRNTAKEFLKDAETVPDNPDGYTGVCHVEQEEDNPVLITEGTTQYLHYGIPLGNIEYSAYVSGTGFIKIYAIKNSDSTDLENDRLQFLGEIRTDSNKYNLCTCTFTIPDNPETEYEQICEGYGDKIMGIKIEYSEGLRVKQIALVKNN